MLNRTLSRDAERRTRTDPISRKDNALIVCERGVIESGNETPESSAYVNREDATGFVSAKVYTAA